jgi:prophage tail gpP-like protein
MDAIGSQTPQPVLLPINAPNAEQAVINVSGQLFSDWETVFVQTRWMHAWDYCRFTATERLGDNSVINWREWQIKPCDVVSVTLANQLVMTGVITERQVAYDVMNHGVQLLGKGSTKWGYMSSVNTQTSSFDNMSFEAIAKAVLTPYLAGNAIKTVGNLNPLPFEKVQCQVGESCWDFLENLSRVRGIAMGSDENGNYVFVGDHSTQPIATLLEGFNIKSMQCSINIDDNYVIYQAVGQKAASDSSGGAASQDMHAEWGGSGCRISILKTPAEQPVTQPELQDRAKQDAKWHEAAKVTVTAIVYGWLWAPGQLWRVGQSVWVKSPMCPLDEKMIIQRCTYTQDRQNGTQTTLDLVMPWMLNDTDVNLGPFAQQAPQAPTQDQLSQVIQAFGFPL